MRGHVVPVGLYIVIFLSLMVLTGLTVGVAFINLGVYNTVAALTIAVVKMLLVVLFFMHVRYSSALTKLIIAAGFFWLALLIAFTLTDVKSRGWSPRGRAWGPATMAPAQPAEWPAAPGGEVTPPAPRP
jgi:cytochrome c oxidase subunit 4